MGRTVRFIIAVIVVVLVLQGCKKQGAAPQPQGKKQITICFAFQDLETGFWVAAHKAITETLKGKGIKVFERNGNEDANRQLEQIKDAIAQGVDAVILIPQDGESAVTIIGECNRSRVPIGVFNRPPTTRENPTLAIVADNEKITEQAVGFMAEEARRKFEKTGQKVTPLIVCGDLGDRNAVARRQGFLNVIQKNPDIFNPVIEVASKWDAATCLANLEAALQANPRVDLIFISSDFLYPQVRAVLEPIGRWKKRGEEGHVILGGIDGDTEACRLMQAGYVDATGVQDLFYEAKVLLDALLAAIEAGEKTPANWMDDPGFALTQANMAEKQNDMWGCKLLAEGE
jgi:ABC-type sugar transport system substrate-binding protein